MSGFLLLLCHAMWGGDSDDRSQEAFKERIIGATQMQEVVSVDRFPNCLILDEIDGATKAAINVLVSVVTAETVKGKARRRALPPLRRPIICICNDVNAPVLRALRDHALCLTLEKTDTHGLTARLTQVCSRKHIKTDLQALNKLCTIMVSRTFATSK